MFYSPCRHWSVKWLDDCRAECLQCGRLGLWHDGMVIWQRRPAASYRLGGARYALCQERPERVRRPAAG